MNIYLHVEIASRELDAKILLGIEAAERGHNVFVGSIESLEKPLLSGLLPPGIFHTKDLCPTPKKTAFLEKLKQRGFVITSQDEETILVEDNPESGKGIHRFGSQSLDVVSAVFFFGSRDRVFVEENFPAYREKFFTVGSPRFDLWETTSTLRNRGEQKKRVGCISNFNFPFIGSAPIDAISQAIVDNELVDSMEVWDEFLAKYRAQSQAAMGYLRFIENLATALPDVHFVIRPHPSESNIHWKKFIENRHDNLNVENEGSSHDFLYGVSAVIHNGCTTGFEAYLSNVPCVAYGVSLKGHEYRSEHSLVNRLGLAFNDADGAAKFISLVMRGEVDGRRIIDEEVASELSKRLCTDQSKTASSQIVDKWEELWEISDSSAFVLSRVVFWFLVREFRYSANFYGRMRFKEAVGKNQKFPDQSKRQFSDRVAMLEKRLKKSPGAVSYIRLDRQLLLLPGVKN